MSCNEHVVSKEFQLLEIGRTHESRESIELVEEQQVKRDNTLPRFPRKKILRKRLLMYDYTEEFGQFHKKNDL